MHEMMVAQSLLAIISDEAAKHDDARPVGARISCGTLNAINDEALCFAFEAIAKDTPCEGLKFQIEHKPIRAQCKNCGPEFDVEFSHPACPRCGGENFELLPDAPLLLEEIDFQTD